MWFWDVQKYWKTPTFAKNKYCIFVKLSLGNLVALFKKYKSVLRFLGLFIGTYLLLGFLYAWYLKRWGGSDYFPDFLTHLVARQSGEILQSLGYTAQLFPYGQDQGMLLTIANSYSVNIVEGCNSASVIILFVAFVIAFAQNFKKTVLFLLAGAILIYIINLWRIVFLVIALYRFPEYQDFLHSIVFPGIIYGFVFLLWMVWVRLLQVKEAR